jgi:Bifunctional DNA primase/polymerase, N-terminal/Primase C terminal 1 (PriCT-1)
VKVTTERAERNGIFSTWQAEYAAHNIATFPVRISADDKRPAIKHYNRIGLSASAKLATRFANDNAFGFMLDERNKVTVLDVDTTDEGVLARALERHGATPVIVRSGSGNHQAWYRHNGEHRLIRPWPDRPIDLLGAGFIVAPPSATEKGAYQFIQGSLGDLGRLPVLRNLDLPKAGAKEGARNKSLFEHCMRHANHVDDFDALIDVARTFNDNCEPPMEDSEVVTVASNAWRYTERGENRFGRKGVFFDKADVIRLLDEDPDLYLMLSLVRAHNGPDAEFIMTIEWLAETLGWWRTRVIETRRRLIAGYAQLIRPSRQRVAALYRWRRV